jgi:hypothetical protein
MHVGSENVGAMPSLPIHPATTSAGEPYAAAIFSAAAEKL